MIAYTTQNKYHMFSDTEIEMNTEIEENNN